jgi:hypothetical protein
MIGDAIFTARIKILPEYLTIRLNASSVIANPFIGITEKEYDKDLITN